MHIHKYTELTVVWHACHLSWHCFKNIIDMPLSFKTLNDIFILYLCCTCVCGHACSALCMWRLVENFRMLVSSTVWVSGIELRLSGRAGSSWAVSPVSLDPRPQLWKRSSEFPFQASYMCTLPQSNSLCEDVPRGPEETRSHQEEHPSAVAN